MSCKPMRFAFFGGDEEVLWVREHVYEFAEFMSAGAFLDADADLAAYRACAMFKAAAIASRLAVWEIPADRLVDVLPMYFASLDALFDLLADGFRG